jgi:hypothetical protein
MVFRCLSFKTDMHIVLTSIARGNIFLYWGILPYPILDQGPSWTWSHDSWIYNYLCNRCLSPLMLRVQFLLRTNARCSTLCDKVCQWLAQVGVFRRVLRFPPPIKLTATIYMKYCWKWRLKHHKTIKLTLDHHLHTNLQSLIKLKYCSLMLSITQVINHDPLDCAISKFIKYKNILLHNMHLFVNIQYSILF